MVMRLYWQSKPEWKRRHLVTDDAFAPTVLCNLAVARGVKKDRRKGRCLECMKRGAEGMEPWAVRWPKRRMKKDDPNRKGRLGVTELLRRLWESAQRKRVLSEREREEIEQACRRAR